MAYTFQVVIDSGDPHVLADWWAETLGWRVEAQDATFIRSMIDQGQATEADTREYRGALVWREGAAIHPDEEASPQRARILFQQVPEAKTVKNRAHIDLRLGDDGRPGRQRVLRLTGGARNDERAQYIGRWNASKRPSCTVTCQVLTSFPTPSLSFSYK